MALIDSTTPVLDLLSRPVATVSELVQEVRELASLQETNTVLKLENARLLQWEHAARTLLAENDQLRTLLNFAGDDTARSGNRADYRQFQWALYTQLADQCGNARWRSPRPRGRLWSGVARPSCVDRREVRAGPPD